MKMQLLKYKSNFSAVKKLSLKQFIICFLCIGFIAASVLYSVFIITRSVHNHDSNGANRSCSVCVHLAQLDGLIKQRYLPPAPALSLILYLIVLSFSLYKLQEVLVVSTLVSQKIRLNR